MTSTWLVAKGTMAWATVTGVSQVIRDVVFPGYNAIFTAPTQYDRWLGRVDDTTCPAHLNLGSLECSPRSPIGRHAGAWLSRFTGRMEANPWNWRDSVRMEGLEAIASTWRRQDTHGDSNRFAIISAAPKILAELVDEINTIVRRTYLVPIASTTALIVRTARLMVHEMRRYLHLTYRARWALRIT